MVAISGTLKVFDTAESLADGVAAWLTDIATATDDDIRICLSGGSTPKRLYERLAQSPYREQFPWRRSHWFFGDERFVPADHKDSNFRMATLALLSQVPIPEGNIHRIDTTDAVDAEDAADSYSKVLRDAYGSSTLDPGRPLFDVTFLGLGPDGHTASLIPGEPVLGERSAWVAPVAHGRPEARITLTYPALESSSAIAFLVVGADKAAMVREVRSGGSGVPAAHLAPQGEVIWFADKAAAANA